MAVDLSQVAVATEMESDPATGTVPVAAVVPAAMMAVGPARVVLECLSTAFLAVLRVTK